MRIIHGTEVFGADIDPETRCTHWHSRLDIIAIKFKCCERFYPCFQCHGELAGHPAEVWQADDVAERAVLCGSCGRRLSIEEYLGCSSICPGCAHPFNPACANHYHLYFSGDIFNRG